MFRLKMKEVIIYTDGACSGNPGPGGCAAVIRYKSHEKVLSEGFALTTNNRMELLSAIKALETLKEPCAVTLYSDSQYLVRAVTQGWLQKWKQNGWARPAGKAKKKLLNADLWQRLCALLETHRVAFVWVRGHASNEQNNRCDEIARQIIKSGELNADMGYLNSPDC